MMPYSDGYVRKRLRQFRAMLSKFLEEGDADMAGYCAAVCFRAAEELEEREQIRNKIRKDDTLTRIMLRP